MSPTKIKWTLALALAANVAGLTACDRDTYQIKQEHNMDRRGMIHEQDVVEDRVNTNLPQGGSEAEKQYRNSPNIRPGDANGGVPNTIEGNQPVPTGSPAPLNSPAPLGSPAPSRIGPSHPHH